MPQETSQASQSRPKARYWFKAGSRVSWDFSELGLHLPQHYVIPANAGVTADILRLLQHRPQKPWNVTMRHFRLGEGRHLRWRGDFSTKLAGKVEAVRPGSLPNDGKVIADDRDYSR